eukprot:3308685-Prymnesium_polylepis.1
MLGIRHIARWLGRNPMLLTLDVEEQIKPAVLYLRSIDNLNVGKVLSSVPLSHGFAPPERTQAKVQWLEAELGVDDIGTF